MCHVNMLTENRKPQSTKSHNEMCHVNKLNETKEEEAMASPKTHLLRFLLVLCINFQLLENQPGQNWFQS